MYICMMCDVCVHVFVYVYVRDVYVCACVCDVHVCVYLCVCVWCVCQIILNIKLCKNEHLHLRKEIIQIISLKFPIKTTNTCILDSVNAIMYLCMCIYMLKHL